MRTLRWTLNPRVSLQETEKNAERGRDEGHVQVEVETSHVPTSQGMSGATEAGRSQERSSHEAFRRSRALPAP